MADTGTKCCLRSGPMRTFKVKGIEMVLKCAAERNDEETIVKMQAVLDGEGQLAAVTLHKSCYCSYTSKHNIQKHTAHKRKAESNLVEEQPSSRIRRSQVDRFDFMSQCHLCQSMNTKHPERWDRVVQCERKGVKGASSFKDSHELCAVPPSLIDEHRCLRKGNKSDLVKRLGVPETAPLAAESVIIDVSQLLYHIVWPHGGSASDLVGSIKNRLNRY